MMIGFIFTNYNNSSYTKAAVKSIVENKGANECHIVIVDNKSEIMDIKLLEELNKEYTTLDIIYNDDILKV